VTAPAQSEPQAPARRSVAGIVLTGGASRRMGTDKALLRSELGVPWAESVGRLLVEVADPVIEVGPGWSGLPSVLEELRGEGPLVAVAAGAAALAAQGWSGPALVLSCDLPRLKSAVVRWLAGWPGHGGVVPVVGGRPQPLCARWSAADLAAAGSRVAEGERSLRGLPGSAPCSFVGPSEWTLVADADAFADADTPAEAAQAGVLLARGASGGGEPALGTTVRPTAVPGQAAGRMARCRTTGNGMRGR